MTFNSYRIFSQPALLIVLCTALATDSMAASTDTAKPPPAVQKNTAPGQKSAGGTPDQTSMQAIAAPVTSESISIVSAINKAGRQRMLTQRMGKAYAMLALGIEADRAQNLMAQSVALFDTQLAELRTQVPNDAIKKALDALGNAWKEYKANLNLEPTPENGRLVYSSGEDALKRAHELTGLYEKQLNTPQGHLVNIAGRERMLSQRMARAYFFKKWGIVKADQDLDTARQEFAAGLQELIKAPENTERIEEELRLAEQQWLFFQRAIDEVDKTPNNMSERNVATTSERILEQMNAVTALYEHISK